MTELEKIAYAKSFIDRLANGFNPLDNSPLAEGDIANNVRISRCFFYVSDILRQVIENGGVAKPKKQGRLPFALTAEQAMSFEYSENPISLTEIARRINDLVDLQVMKKLSYRQLSDWLINMEFLKIDTTGTGPRKLPTEEGEKLGISVELRINYRRGEYMAIVYNKQAQEFILDNIEAIIASNIKE